MTLAPEIASSDSRAAPSAPAVSQSVAPADSIPLQIGPSFTVSLTDGCDTPLEAIRSAARDLAIRCHPCDEAIVRLLLVRVRRSEDLLVVTPGISPGTLCFG